MFGLNDDDKPATATPASDQPAPAEAPMPAAPAEPAPTEPAPAPAEEKAINPITGSETLGPPQVSSGTPSIISGTGSSMPTASITKNQGMVPNPQTGSPLTALSATLTPAPAPALAMTASAPPVPPAAASSVDPLTSGNHDDLLNLKKEALQNLTPLVGQLEQDPAEKFKTLMMLLQASDNPQLVKEAYEMANKIPDEKARAQALLDIVNEINYFTHPEKRVDDPTA